MPPLPRFQPHHPVVHRQVVPLKGGGTSVEEGEDLGWILISGPLLWRSPTKLSQPGLFISPWGWSFTRGDSGGSCRGVGNEASKDGALVVNSETGDTFHNKLLFWGSFSYLPVLGRAVADSEGEQLLYTSVGFLQLHRKVAGMNPLLHLSTDPSGDGWAFLAGHD